MRSVFLNDQPYTDGQEDPHKALGDTLSFSVDDWAATRAMAWTWGIVNGWDDEAMAELAQEFGWDEATTARLNRLHAAFDAALTGGAEERLRAALDPELLAQAIHGSNEHPDLPGCLDMDRQTATDLITEYARLKGAPR